VKTLFNILLTMAILSLTAKAYNSIERIPVDDIRMPGHDLLLPNGENIGPERLYQEATKERNPLDLSVLQPQESEVWKNKLGGESPLSEDFLSLKENPIVSFSGHLISAPEQMRFNVLSSHDKEFYTLVLDKSLHTMLMRKNLLRKLGYIIPKTDYRRSVRVRFATLEEMDEFQKKALPKATLGASARWVTKRDEKTLTLHLQDVALMKPSEKDHFNFAMGVIPKTHVQRTIRSLIIPYALLNVKESINQVPWSVGHLDNKNYLLPHFALGNLNPSINDIKWSLRRLERLSREELSEVVKRSYYPLAVEKVLIEKIISRRNSLLKLFNIKHTPYPFNIDLSYKDSVHQGKIIKQNWKGYAARFSFGDPESPFDDVKSHILTEVQKEAFGHLTVKLAEKLTAFDLTAARKSYFEEQFRVGMEHFVETGEIIEFGLGSWRTPVLNGNLILNRSIVLGSYLGSDNVVQLADTFGFALEAGLHIGLENLPGSLTSAFSSGGVNYLKTFTHLKPVNSLKESLKEPYKNLYVPLVKKMLRTTAQDLAELTEKIKDHQIEGEEFKGLNESQQEQFEQLFSQINKFLGVGESIIITRKIIPAIRAGLSLSKISAALNVTGGLDATFLKRLHIYRKNENEIQIYNDLGKTKGRSLSFGLGSGGQNILRLNFGKSRGDYKVNFHKMNISTDLENNENFSQNALALAKTLKDGDVSLLNEVAPPYIIDGDFQQKVNRMKLLFITDQKVKAHNTVKLTDPENYKSQYLTIDRQRQSGQNYQLFVTEIVNHWLRNKGKDFSFSAETYKNPAFTFFGHAQRVKSRFESRYDDKLISKPFMSVSTSLQGWRIKRKNLQRRLKKINKQYKRALFNDHTLQDISKMRVYDIQVNLNLYEKGVKSLKAITLSEIKSLEKKYKKEYQCDNTSGGKNSFKCGDLHVVKRIHKKCHQKKMNPIETNSCFLNLLTTLKEQIQFDDLSRLLGQDHYYLYGNVTGFRSDSEILYEPEKANGFGRIGSRDIDGPVQQLIRLLGIQNGEFNGSWLRTLL